MKERILLVMVIGVTICLVSIHYLSAISFLLAILFSYLGRKIEEGAYDARTRESNRIWNAEMKLLSGVCALVCISVLVIKFSGQDPEFVLKNLLMKCQ